jgi:hypothetical protein
MEQGAHRRKISEIYERKYESVTQNEEACTSNELWRRESAHGVRIPARRGGAGDEAVPAGLATRRQTARTRQAFQHAFEVWAACGTGAMFHSSSQSSV